MTRDFDSSTVDHSRLGLRRSRQDLSGAEKTEDELVAKRKLLGLNHDEINNFDTTFKKLTKMSIGL
jgi:hypothetical protein